MTAKSSEPSPHRYFVVRSITNSAGLVFIELVIGADVRLKFGNVCASVKRLSADPFTPPPFWTDISTSMW